MFSTTSSRSKDTHLDKLKVISKKAARIILFKPRRAHSLFLTLNWISLDKQWFRLSAIAIHKILLKLGSTLLHPFFRCASNQQDSRVTRSRTNRQLIFDTPKVKFFKDTLFCAGARRYNDLELDLCSQTCLPSFKSLLKSHH